PASRSAGTSRRASARCCWPAPWPAPTGRSASCWNGLSGAPMPRTRTAPRSTSSCCGPGTWPRTPRRRRGGERVPHRSWAGPRAVRGRRGLLDRPVGRTAAPAADVAAVDELMLRTGAVAAVSEEVQERAARAAQILDRAEGLGEEGRAGLAALAAQATEVVSLAS